MKKVLAYALVWFIGLFILPFAVFARGWHRQPQPVPPPVVIPSAPTPSSLQLGIFNNGHQEQLGTYTGLFLGDGDDFNYDVSYWGIHGPLVVYWESSLTASEIENGAADSFLKIWATEMKSYGQPIIFAPLDEMQGSWNPYSGNPTAYKAAWVRLYGFFSARTSVKLAYDPNAADGFPVSSLTAYYPGSQYVDLVGLDGFGSSEQSWAAVFASSMGMMQSFGKPFWILSTGTSGSFSQFVSDSLTAAKTYGISGFVFYDAPPYELTSAQVSTLQAL